MPQLNRLVCSIEAGPRDKPLPEYDPFYGDGWVESFIAVPSASLGDNFCVHLTSKGYIDEGLAMFVFIDAKPQCNRNRVGLVPTTNKADSWRTEVDFRVRQKETKFDSGGFIGRPWSFKELQTFRSNSKNNLPEDVIDNIGTIEVVVLRCKASDKQSAYRVPDKRAGGSRAQVTGTQTNTFLEGLTVRSAIDDEYGFDGSHAGGGVDGQLDGGDDYRVPPFHFPPSPPVPEQFREPLNAGRRTSPNQMDGNGNAGFNQNQLNNAFNQNANRTDKTQRYASGQTPMVYPTYPAYPYQNTMPNMGWNYAVPPAQYYPYNTQWMPPGMHTSPNQNHTQPYGQHYGGYVGGGMYDPNVPYSRGYMGTGVFDPNAPNTQQRNGNGSNNSAAGDHYRNDNNNAGNNWESNNNAGNNWESNNHDQSGNNWDSNNSGNNWGDNNNTSGNDWGENNANTGDTWGNKDNNQQNGDTWGNDTAQSDCKAAEKAQKKQRTHSKKVEKMVGFADSQPVADKLDEPKSKEDDTSPPNPPRPFIKSYFQPRRRNSGRRADSVTQDATNMYIVPEEPLLMVPENVKVEREISHQVQAGKGARYNHRTSRPKYIDTMEDPYAIFIFKYRSAELLSKKLDAEIKETKGDYRAKMREKSKEDILDELMRAKARLGYDTNSSLDSSSEDGRTK